MNGGSPARPEKKENLKTRQAANPTTLKSVYIVDLVGINLIVYLNKSIYF